MNDNAGSSKSIGLTADIVAAYVSNNSLQSTEIPALINRVYAALAHASSSPDMYSVGAKPTVAIKDSVTADFIVCLEDGMKFKALKRHLRTKFNMTPDQYRQKWGLDSEYPMVAPNYSAVRAQLAMRIGLGQQRPHRKNEKRVVL